jgi:class 3 adenylate cyclase
MEKNVAILMADLSGYSALTETHGAVTAADLIDKYISLAENCLVGDCRLHQQTGDEIMFVSDSSDVMLATAKQLAANTAKVEYFLQVHGGLHYGKVLKRGANYFGSTVNLAARIAAKAAAGSFYCSAEFINSITDKSACFFQSQGNHPLKNISEEKELFELNIDKIKTNYIDPVCRMLILHPANAFRHPNEELYFCSSQCLNVYKENQAMVQSS